MRYSWHTGQLPSISSALQTTGSEDKGSEEEQQVFFEGSTGLCSLARQWPSVQYKHSSTVPCVMLCFKSLKEKLPKGCCLYMRPVLHRHGHHTVTHSLLFSCSKQEEVLPTMQRPVIFFTGLGIAGGTSSCL
jgi:hypothetical protein